MPKRSASAPSRRQSAGILLFRRERSLTEVPLGHPGGPFWKNKDEGAWGIPKGLIAEGEDPLDAAKREFVEETGHMPRGDFISLGDAKQAGGKTSMCSPCKATGTQLIFKAIVSRWNGPLNPAGCKVFLSSTR